MLNTLVDYVELNFPSLIEGDNLFYNYYPDNPDDIVSIIANSGFTPHRYNDTRELIFEFKLRNKDYELGMDLGNQIFNLFHSKENYVLGDFFIFESYCLTEISYLYSDLEERDQFSFEIVFITIKNI